MLDNRKICRDGRTKVGTHVLPTTFRIIIICCLMLNLNTIYYDPITSRYLPIASAQKKKFDIPKLL